MRISALRLGLLYSPVGVPKGSFACTEGATLRWRGNSRNPELTCRIDQ